MVRCRHETPASEVVRRQRTRRSDGLRRTATTVGRGRCAVQSNSRSGIVRACHRHRCPPEGTSFLAGTRPTVETRPGDANGSGDAQLTEFWTFPPGRGRRRALDVSAPDRVGTTRGDGLSTSSGEPPPAATADLPELTLQVVADTDRFDRVGDWRAAGNGADRRRAPRAMRLPQFPHDDGTYQKR